jgi:hypothetical protein
MAIFKPTIARALQLSITCKRDANVKSTFTHAISHARLLMQGCMQGWAHTTSHARLFHRRDSFFSNCHEDNDSFFSNCHEDNGSPHGRIGS